MHRLQHRLSAGKSHLKHFGRSIAQNWISPNRTFETTFLYSALLAFFLMCGVLFYLFYRMEALQWILHLALLQGLFPEAASSVFLLPLPAAIQYSFPSLISGLSIALFIAALSPVNQTAWRTALLSSTTTLLLLEAAFGHFDWQDVSATLIGITAGICAVGLMQRRYNAKHRNRSAAAGLPNNTSQSNAVSRRQELFPTTAAIVFSSLLVAGSYQYDDTDCARFDENGLCEEYKRSAQPIYMSYQELRDSVASETARPLNNLGRLYLYGDYVFLNEINEGIHVIDNTDQMSPVNVAFIRIPGNIDFAIRDNYMYADSYVDLITININDPQQLTVIARDQNIFPYDAYQNIPQNIVFSNADIDPLRGVVVSYRMVEEKL